MKNIEKEKEKEIEVKFREWINQNAWFYCAIIKNNIIWNFNLFVFPNLKYSYLAVRSDNAEIIKELKKLGYLIIDDYKGITLLKRHTHTHTHTLNKQKIIKGGGKTGVFWKLLELDFGRPIRPTSSLFSYAENQWKNNNSKSRGRKKACA
jgi:hypothetical protein